MLCWLVASSISFLVGCDSGGGAADAPIAQAVCGLTSPPAGARPCAPADVGLSSEICRCGSRWYWDGTACVATAACTCTRNCDLLYATPDDCRAAHAACRDAGP